MFSAQDAESLILQLVQPLDPSRDVESVELVQAIGRILAQPVTSQLDFPHWDNSAMDGYAVRFEDVQHTTADRPVSLEIIEEIPAGKTPQRSLSAGQAARLFTGAMMPNGADTVIMQENTQRTGDRVSILASPPEKGHFVRHRASYYSAGQPLLSKGIKLTAPEIAILAAAQFNPLQVYRRLRVAILSTGDELVPVNQPLAPGQIVDSNYYAIAALLHEFGAEPIYLGIIPDQPEALRRAIASALQQADLIISSGGVSVGDYDYVETILTELGATLHIRSVAVRPGKPLTVATFENDKLRPVPYFGLPGNPASALVGFWRFVLPALRKLSGLATSWKPTWVKGRSHHDLKSDGKRETYLWGTTHLMDGEYEFHLAGGSHSSGNLINLSQTNAIAVLPIGTTHISAGEPIALMLVNSNSNSHSEI